MLRCDTKITKVSLQRRIEHKSIDSASFKKVLCKCSSLNRPVANARVLILWVSTGPSPIKGIALEHNEMGGANPINIEII